MKKILLLTTLSVAALFLTVGQLSCGSTPEQNKPATTSDSNTGKHTATTERASSSATPNAALPNVASKPQPSWDPNWPCAPEGDANGPNPKSDPVLNKL